MGRETSAGALANYRGRMLCCEMTTASSQPSSFQLQPTLVGELLELRPLRPEDFDALFAAASDPLIWAQHPESDRYKEGVFHRYFDTAIESGGAFAIVDRATARIIGSTRYYNWQPDGSEIEIGWTFLERGYWGGIYNRELKALMLNHAFKFVSRVVFIVGTNNARSRKAVEKIGGRFLRDTKRSDRHGNAAENVVYGIDRSAWTPT
jgi:RimJ/RimL family protein N-acetyltransferase